MTNNIGRPRLHQVAVSNKSGLTAPTIKSPTLAVPSSKTPQPSRSPSRVRPTGKPIATAAQADVTSDKTTASLIRRVLCPSGSHGPDQRERGSPRPLEESLPPLTSSNEVDLQLYALIAIIIKEFIYDWYSKITPDRDFAEEIIQIIAHCTRALEQRLRQVDVDALVLDEIPALIEAHIVAYRTASQNPELNRSQSYFRTVYHTLNPHPALSPVPDASDPTTIAEQEKREAVYRQLLAQGVLATLLPTEDLENICLRTLVGDILADMILGEVVSGTASEGPFIWEIITQLISARNRDEQRSEKAEHVQKTRLERFALLSGKEESRQGDSSGTSQSDLSMLLWSILQYSYLTYITIRFVLVGLFRVASSSIPMSSQGRPSASPPSSPVNPACEGQPWSNSGIARPPVLKYRLFDMVSQLVDVSRRMPWLGGALALIQHALVEGPGKFGETDEILDRFLHETIQKHLLTPTFLPVLLRAIRTTLFPLNTRPGPTENISMSAAAPPIETRVGSSTVSDGKTEMRSSLKPSPAPTLLPVALQAPPVLQPPSKAQTKAIKRECAASILSLIPNRAALAIFCISTPLAGKSRPKSKYTSATNTTTRSRSRASNSDTDPADTRNSSVSPLSSSPAPRMLGAKSMTPQAMREGLNSSGYFTTARIPSLSPNSISNQARKIDAHAPVPSSHESEINDHDDSEEDNEGNDGHEALLLSAIEHDILDLFADSYCNKHLMYSIIETVLVKLLPEISEHGVGELMAERGI